MLNRLKEGKRIQLGPTAIRDLDLFDVETLLQKLSANSNEIESQGDSPKDTTTPEATHNLGSGSTEDKDAEPKVSVKRHKSKDDKESNSSVAPAYEKGDLRNISLNISKGVSVSDAVAQAECIRSTTEHIKGKNKR